jgi:hypothetical protein
MIVDADWPTQDYQKVGTSRNKLLDIPLRYIHIFDLVASMPQRRFETFKIFKPDMANGLQAARSHGGASLL